MLNLRINNTGLVTTAEYPSVPSKINGTDVILQINDNKLEQEILHKNGKYDVKITNLETLEYEIIQKDLPIIDEQVDEEKIAMAEAIIDLESRISKLEGGNK